MCAGYLTKHFYLVQMFVKMLLVVHIWIDSYVQIGLSNELKRQKNPHFKFIAPVYILASSQLQ